MGWKGLTMHQNMLLPGNTSQPVHNMDYISCNRQATQTDKATASHIALLVCTAHKPEFMGISWQFSF